MAKKVLLIDDHDEIRTAIEYLLENAERDYKVFSCRTADEGLNRLKENPEIRVIILDIIMPVKNGIQTLLELNSGSENFRIIVLTGYPGKFDADKAKELGVFRYLPKPPEEEPLIFAIEAAFTDIQVKQMEKELQVAKQWEELGILATDFVHWVGNKVSLIPGYIGLIQEDVKNLSPASKGKCQKINDIVKEIISKKAEILEPFKVTKAELVSIVSLINEVISHFDFFPGVEINRVYTSESAKAYINPAEFKKVIEELFINANEAMRNSSERRLDITILSEESPKDKVLIKIKDSGIGIKNEDRDKVFRAFYTSEGSRGYGVGLFVVKNTLAKFKSTIYCNSKYGEWTEFTIILQGKEI
jgi:CheY-like chemotaxis protein/two-component sensor histidine kinase